MRSGADSADPKRVVEEGYDRVCAEYARLEGPAVWPRLRWLTKLLDRLKPNSAVLDLGCGSGDPADIELARLHKVTGVDISRQQLARARQNVPGGVFILADISVVTFPAHSFDAVISFYTLEHLPRTEHEQLFRRIYQWLRPPGLLLLSSEAGDYQDAMGTWLGVPMFFSCFDPETVQRLISEAGLVLLETAIETQIEQGQEIPYLWVLAQKQEGLTSAADRPQ